MPTQEQVATKKKIVWLYAEEINMMEVLADEELDQSLKENSKIVSWFEIDVAGIITLNVAKKEMESKEDLRDPNQSALAELEQAQDTLEWKMQIS